MERSALAVFFFCMPLTATLVLYFIWTGGPGHDIFLPRITATSFVIGLASFLTWFVSFAYRFRNSP